MAILKFELSKAHTLLRLKMASDVRERLGRSRAFCGDLELADLVEHGLVNVMNKDMNLRAQEKERAANPAMGGQRWSVKWVSPAR